MKTRSMALLSLCLMTFGGLALAQGGAAMEEQGSTGMKKMDKGAMEKPTTRGATMEKGAMTGESMGKTGMKPTSHGMKTEAKKEEMKTPGTMERMQ